MQQILDDTSIRSIEYHESIGSTNDRAKELARSDGLLAPALIVAGHQTAGRGRGAHDWWTGDGTLAFSLLFDRTQYGIDTRWVPLIALAAGCSLCRTVRQLLEPNLAPGQLARLGLRWPNDLYFGAAKLSGTLVEMVSGRWCVVGIGMNTNNRRCDAPKELTHARRITTLRDITDQPVDHTQLLVTLLTALDRDLRRLAESPDQITAEADTLCVQKGQQITVRQTHASYTGRCIGIDSSGQLLLDVGSEIVAIHSGQIDS